LHGLPKPLCRQRLLTQPQVYHNLEPRQAPRSRRPGSADPQAAPLVLTVIPCVNATGPLEGSNRHQVLGADTPPGEAKTTLRLAVGDSWTVAVSGPNLQPVTEYRSGCFVLGPPLMIEPQRTYRLRVRYQPVGHLRAAILDVFGQTLWDTGRVPAYGRLSFDRVRFGVRSNPGSKLHWDPQRQAVLLRGANGPEYVVSAYVDNVVVKCFDR